MIDIVVENPTLLCVPFVLLVMLSPLITAVLGVGYQKKRLDEAKAVEIPPDVRDRCAMCGQKELIWGIYATRDFFNPDGKRLVRLRRNNIFKRAAQCPRCGYIMIFEERI